MQVRWYLTPAEAAPLIHWDPQYLREVARGDPGQLPFRVVCHGKRVQIPRAEFFKWLKANQEARICNAV